MTQSRLLGAFFVIVLLAIAANTYIGLRNSNRIKRVERIVQIIEVQVKGVVPGRTPTTHGRSGPVRVYPAPALR